MATLRVYIVTENYLPKIGSFPSYWRSRCLAEAGFDVAVVTTKENDEGNIDPDLHITDNRIKVAKSSAGLCRHVDSFVNRASMGRITSRLWSRAFTKDLTTLIAQAPGIILAEPGSAELLFAAHDAATSTASPFAVDFRNFHLSGLSRKKFAKLCSCVNDAALVIVPNRNMERDFTAYFNLEASRLGTVENGICGRLPQVSLRKSGGTIELICNTGFGTDFDIPGLCKATDVIRHTLPAIAEKLRIVLYGAAGEETRKSLADHLEDEFLETGGLLSHGAIPAIYSGANAAILPLSDLHDRGDIPQFLYDCIAYGIPVIGFGPECAAGNLLQNSGSGIWLADATPETIAAVLASVAKSPEKLEEMFAGCIDIRNKLLYRRNVPLIASRLKALNRAQ